MTQKNLREKLEERYIQPSENAWTRLDSMLEEKMQPGTIVKKRNYMAIAAVFIGLAGIFLTSYFLLNTSPSKNIVKQQSHKKNTEQVLPSNDTQKLAIPTTAIHENNIDYIKTSSNKTSVKQPQIIEETTVFNEKKEHVDSKKDMTTNMQNELKIAEVTPQNKRHLDVDMESELLLGNAIKELNQKKKNNVLTQAKASILLDEAENDIQKDNRSIKGKIYNEIDKKYYQIKTAFTDK